MVVGEPLHTPYPTFFAVQLINRFARPGDTLVAVNCDNPMLRIYAVRTPNGKGRLLVINKMRSTTLARCNAIRSLVCCCAGFHSSEMHCCWIYRAVLRGSLSNWKI